MSESDRREHLTRRLMAVQSRLYAYIVALVSNPDQAHDILQEANVVMLRKLDEAPEGEGFMGWAHRVCHFEVLGYVRDRARDRGRLSFDDTVLSRIADAAAQQAGVYDDRVRALFDCLEQLPDDQRQLIEQRYRSDESVQALAEHLGRPYGSVRQALYRVRQALVDCVEGKLAAEGAG